MILLRKLIVNNFLIFEGIHVFEFDKNNFILGDNGSGKSTIYDALLYGFYGKLGKERNINISEIINEKIDTKSYKKSDEVVYVELEIEKDKDIYILHRGRSLSNKHFVWIKKNNKTLFPEKFKEISYFQSWVDKEFLYGIDYDLFLYTHKYHSDNVKISDMSSQQIEKMFDSVLSFDIIEKISNKIKSKHKEYRDLSIKYEEKLKSLKEQQNSILAEQKKKQENIQDKLIEIDKEIKINENKITTIKKEIDKINEEVTKYNQELEEKKNQLRKVEKEIIGIQKNVDLKVKSISELETTQKQETCPTCKQPINKQVLEKYIVSENKEIDLLNNSIQDKQKIEELLKKEVITIEEKYNQIKEEKNKKEMKISELKLINKSLFDKKSILENNVKTQYDDLLKQITKQGKEISKEYYEIYKQFNIYKYLYSFFGQNYIKYIIYKQFIDNEINPVIYDINKFILKKYSVKFNINYEKNKTGNSSKKKGLLKIFLDITRNNINGQLSKSKAYSSGEKRLIDIIMFLTFISFLNKHNKFLGFIFMDEFMDNLDDTNKQILFDLMINIFDKLNIQFFLISHTLKQFIEENKNNNTKVLILENGKLLLDK